MSATHPTRIFGMRISIDPKILIGALVALAAFLFWYNSRSDEGESASASNAAHPVSVPSNSAVPVISGQHASAIRRTANRTNDRNRLRLSPIDPTRGDVDPTLRLDLLSRLHSVKFESSRRSIFDIGATSATQSQLQNVAQNHPILPPKPIAPSLPVTPSAPPPISIPLKYYGFVRPSGPEQANQGFFLDGDNILVAGEGQVLKQRYMVVELTPNTARVEDTAVKQGQTLPVIPAVLQQQ